MDSEETISHGQPPVEAMEKQKVRELVCTADVVLGIDKVTEEATVFFGRDVLEEAGRQAHSRNCG